MDKAFLLAQLQDLAAHPDTEIAHMKADDLLLVEYIADPEIVEAFHNVKRWYA